MLEIDGAQLIQPLAIVEYLDETRGIGLLPEAPLARARVRALAHAVAMEIHPVCNLRVAKFATAQSGGTLTMQDWMKTFIAPVWRRLRPWWKTGFIALAPRSRSPIFTWCRSFTTRSGRGWIWHPCPGLRGLGRIWKPCRHLPPPTLTAPRTEAPRGVGRARGAHFADECRRPFGSMQRAASLPAASGGNHPCHLLL